MDIREWLDHTELPERAPSLPEQLGLPAFFQPKKVEPAPKDRLRRRRRSVTDSSLLEAHPHRRKALPIERQPDIDDSASDSHGGASPSGSSSSSQRYARRPRRKTRPERYEPVMDVKERGTQLYRHRKNESNKVKRKARRRKGDKPGHGGIQSFQAKNVPKDRLTLKPLEKLGIFSKGRASSPVKGRGLPDLVFSEMKFLQKHKDQPDPIPAPGISKKRRKREPVQAKQEEISAYFTSVRPALADRDVNTHTKDGPHTQTTVRGADREQERSSLPDNAIPTVEIPDKASNLAFGNRGLRHESGSYISWSESVQAPSATPARHRGGSSINIGQLDFTRDGGDGLAANGEDLLHSRARPSSTTKRKAEGSGERFAVSSLATANHPLSRSHSCPQRTCSPRSPDLQGQTHRRRTANARGTPSSSRAHITLERGPPSERDRYRRDELSLETGGSRCPEADAKLFHSQKKRERKFRETQQSGRSEPQSSSSLGKILEDCNSAFNWARSQAVALDAPEAAYVEKEIPPHMEEDFIDTRSIKMRKRLPTVRFVGVEERPLPRPRIPTFTLPNIYEAQRKRQCLQPRPCLGNSYYNQDSYVEHKEYAGGKDERRDFDEDLYTLQVEEALLDMDRGVVEPLKTEQAEQKCDEEQTVVAKRFWRPHRLY
ncbi:hypothetical protein EJ04DRAFT_559992 [Polyplosphaeria fusca]|uniref:Uncharacterized protein n=1 Tax=Polyplosphaeria fusca TaxID=682080 RepID=A0A9P4V7D6_9PLEO|nr:hypothetical protein EJ04DRAFT_559992 [Polyplosphaeria fusca]